MKRHPIQLISLPEPSKVAVHQSFALRILNNFIIIKNKTHKINYLILLKWFFKFLFTCSAIISLANGV